MTQREEQFVATVWRHYHKFGRHDLPWRNTQDPYRILVSEVMLQQTQVDRVILKYKAFLKKFPTIHALSHASLGDVLRAWQGLGYNRRAKMLHACASFVQKGHKGRLPHDFKALKALPGIGPYTAGAIMAFAWNTPIGIVETNIRSAYLFHFFKNKAAISDKQILQYVERTLDAENAREWYYALMDYGAHLKKLHKNPSRRSRHYTTQSKFEGSDRQIRGAIVRELTKNSQSGKALRQLSSDHKRVEAQIEKLIQEGLIQKRKRRYALP